MSILTLLNFWKIYFECNKLSIKNNWIKQTLIDFEFNKYKKNLNVLFHVIKYAEQTKSSIFKSV